LLISSQNKQNLVRSESSDSFIHFQPEIFLSAAADRVAVARADDVTRCPRRNRCRALRKLTGARIDFRFIGERAAEDGEDGEQRECSIDSRVDGVS